MAGKIDKEMLKKHHFWFLFIPVVIALLVAWIGLLASVDDEIEAKEKSTNKDKTESAKYEARPEKTLDLYDKQLTVLDTQRGVLWKAGWTNQKDLYKWPGEYKLPGDKTVSGGYTVEQLNFLNKRRFGEFIPDEYQVRELFAHPDEKVYLNEYKQLVAKLEPMQFRDNNWRAVLKRDRQDWSKRPDSEDMWLAMEDLWVQRELLLAIHKVNADAAAFTLEKSGAKDDPKHRTFKNRTWELELWIDDKGNNRVLRGKLKNISPRLQLMGIGNVMQMEVDLKPDGKKFIFEIQETALEAGQTEPMVVKTLKSHTLPSELKATEIASVRQVFDSRTVPVKRIDYVELGQAGLCDRHNSGMKDGAPWKIRMSSFSEELAKKDKKSEAQGSAGLPPGAPAPAPGVPAAAPPPPKFTYPSQSQDKLERYRYLDRTEQLRRMPVGLVVVTDQMYMDDILESLVNMKLLPLQLTQLEWNRFHDALEYGPKPVGGGMPPGPSSSSPTNSRDDQFSANLMQMSVYGVVSLYEPYPPKPLAPPKK